MTKTELKTLVNEELLDGRAMTDSLFDIQLRLAQDEVEALRPWMILRSEYDGMIFPAGENVANPKDLPTDFRKTRPLKRGDGRHSSLVLKDDNSLVYVHEIPWSRRYELKDETGNFAIDYIHKQFIVTGSLPTSLWAVLSYIRRTPDITDAAPWEFPEDYHPILAYLVAAKEKDRDWDEVNAVNAANYRATARDIQSVMTRWDDELQRSSLEV